MSRHVEGPWYRQSKGGWYATRNGKNVSLRVRGEANKPAAVKAWHRLMADGEAPGPNPSPVRDTPVSPSPASRSAETVKAVADRFLSDARGRLKPNTVRIYSYDIGTFTRGAGSLPLSAVGPGDVGKWVSGLDVNPTTKGMMLRSVGAFFGWAVCMGLLDRNPVKMVAKPKGRSRSQSAVIGEADHGRLVDAATPCFRAVLDVLHSTGCRPSEAAYLTAENTDLPAGVAVLTVHKYDRSGKPRLVFLPPALCERFQALGRTEVAGRDARAEPAEADFGGVPVGRGVDALVRVASHSGQPVRVETVGVEGTGVEVADAGGGDYRVIGRPAGTGAVTAVVRFRVRSVLGVEQLEIPVTAVGVEAPAP